MRLQKIPTTIMIVTILLGANASYWILHYIFTTFSFRDILAIITYLLLIVSMTQENIIKLRLWGACAGTCFIVQFLLSDLPIINVIAQVGLVGYGLYKAYREYKEEKN